jgi:hypothetical protein
MLVANVGVVVGLIFVALEIQTNTESNLIAIRQGYSANWMDINAEVAGNGELAAIIEKADSGGALTPVENRRFERFVSMYLTQVLMMLNLYDQRLISTTEVVGAFRSIREHARYARFRQSIEAIPTERHRALILDDDGLSRWLDIDR